MKHLVFVYGTLKKGHHNHYLLGTARFVAKTQTRDKFRLFQRGFPCLVDAKPGEASYPVQGEVYEVDDETLRQLDWLENEPHLYRRIPIAVQTIDRPVQVYLYQRSVQELPECGPEWPPSDTWAKVAD